MSGTAVKMPPTPVAAPSKRASVAWRRLAMRASSGPATASRPRFSAAHAAAAGSVQVGRRERDVLGRAHRIGAQARPEAVRHLGSGGHVALNLPSGSALRVKNAVTRASYSRGRAARPEV